MINADTYRKPDGMLDWKAYHQAQVKAGEICMRCGSIIVFSHGRPQMCGSCNVMASDPGEVVHASCVRCPHCAHVFDVSSDFQSLYEDGQHELDCPACEAAFEVTTTVHYMSTSPAFPRPPSRRGEPVEPVHPLGEGQ